jgi:DnaJ-class molecular chaperone
MPKFNGGRGNLYVRIQIEFPSSLSNLTDAQRQLLRQLLS